MNSLSQAIMHAHCGVPTATNSVKHSGHNVQERRLKNRQKKTRFRNPKQKMFNCKMSAEKHGRLDATLLNRLHDAKPSFKLNAFWITSEHNTRQRAQTPGA